MDFIALDVETANSDMASICQIGIARFTNGYLVDSWSSLVDPRDWFSPVNISIHGIEPETVIGQPTLPEIAEKIGSMLEGKVVVHHTHFDRVAILRAYAKHLLPVPKSTWLDSARVCRRTWSDILIRHGLLQSPDAVQLEPVEGLRHLSPSKVYE